MCIKLFKMCENVLEHNYQTFPYYSVSIDIIWLQKLHTLVIPRPIRQRERERERERDCVCVFGMDRDVVIKMYRNTKQGRRAKTLVCF